MFYQADDVNPAFIAAEGLLGRNGRIDPHATHKDIAVMTDAFGKIWYGDLDSFEAIHTLADVLQVRVMVIGKDGYSNPRYIADVSEKGGTKA